MITCPKCGFVQPEDRFCASCGVDMQRYESRHRAQGLGWQRLSGHYLVQALLIIGIVGLTSFAIYRKKRAHLLDQLQQMQQLGDRLDDDLADISPPKKPSAAKPKLAADNPQANPAAEVAPEEAESPQAVSEESAAPRGEEAATRTLATLRVFLAEVSIGFLNRMGDLRPLSGQGATGGAIVPHLESRLQSGRSTQEVRNLEEERVPVRPGQAARFARIAPDENNMPLGLEVEFRQPALDERGLHFQIAVTRLLREGPYRYSESITLPSQTGLFVFGLLPRRKPQPNEGFLPEIFQEVMNSPDFLSGASDLVLFVEGPELPDSSR